jgi:hypothetical protein
VKFGVLACQFHLAARRAIQFAPGMAGNVLRGALGHALLEVASAEDYARIFKPTAVAASPKGPSGLSDRPRPFVLRAAGLSGRTVQPGDHFCFDLHLFDKRAGVLETITKAFAQWAGLVSVQPSEVTVDLDAQRAPVSCIRVEFQTPTELRAGGQSATSEFSVLLARARDRISTLRSLYAEGPLEIDFRAFAERARSIKTLSSELRHVAVQRRSGRTGQRHGIGGFVGSTVYEGDLAEFIPYLDAAHWTGVGRHCTWGNGEIHTTILNSDF